MIKKIGYVLDKKQKVQLILLLIIILIGALMELLGVSAILPVINVALDPSVIETTWYLKTVRDVCGFSNARQIIVFFAILLIGIYLLKNIYISLMYNAQYRFIFNNQRALAVRMMECYMKQKYLFHVSKNVAELQRNVTNDVNGFFTVVLNALQLIAEISVCGVLVLFLLVQDFMTTIMVAIMIVVFIVLFAKIFRRVLSKKGTENREVNATLMKWILQAFSGIKEIKVINKETFFVNNYDKYYRRFATLQRQQSMLTFLPRPIMETVCIAGLLLTMVIKLQIGQEDITSFIPTLSVFAIAAFRMLPSFNRITGYLVSIMFNKPSIDAVYKDLCEIDELLKMEKEKEKKTSNLSFTQTIKFENISFQYPESDKWILRNANLEIKKNQSIAFIGASGAGKTTAADLLLGLLEPQEGTITVDEIDVYTGLQEWRERIGYIPQNIYLMDDTIRANIAFGENELEINEDALNRAVKEAQLEELVSGLKEGLNTVIGEQGVKLSGGQRQRIGIARALYRNPDILILDEATSALDNETESEVMKAIDGLHGTRTLIIIAHRLSTIKKCDCIYEVGNEKIELREKV